MVKNKNRKMGEEGGDAIRWWALRVLEKDFLVSHLDNNLVGSTLYTLVSLLWTGGYLGS